VLGTEKWGLGPTGVALKQTGPWTVGMVGARYWADAPDDGPTGWGLRVQLTFLFPK